MRAPVTSAGFGPESQTASCAAPVRDRASGGVWLVDVTTGRGQQLAADGWLPRWLP